MPSDLTLAQIEAQRRLRDFAVAHVERSWRALPAYDEANVPAFLRAVVPVVGAAQRRSALTTGAYLARSIERRPAPIKLAALVGSSVRTGTTPGEVYRRPFVNVWAALGRGVEWRDAVDAGLARAKASAAMDVQLAMRATSAAVQARTPTIQRFVRVADAGACELCQEVDGAILADAAEMGLHNFCGCGVEPLDTPAAPTSQATGATAIHEHGELGPMLANAGDDFTGPGDLH